MTKYGDASDAGIVVLYVDNTVTHKKGFSMRHTLCWAVLAILLSMLAACTAPSAQAPAEQATERHDTPILQDQTHALDKAKALSKHLQGAEHARQQTVESESR